MTWILGEGAGVALQVSNPRARLRGKLGSQVGPDLARGIQSINHGENLLGESGIYPTQHTLILLCPDGKIRTNSEHHIALSIKEKLRWARFGAIDNAHEIMEARNREELAEP